MVPLTIDLSVFGATRGLVLTAPIAALLKAGVAPTEIPAAAASRPRISASTQRATSSAPAPAPAAAPNPPRLAPSPAPAAASDIDAAVARVMAARAVKQPDAVIREILIAKRRGIAKQPIADALGVHHTVVQRVINAEMKHSLTVVG